jgi:CopG family nickel-responsive transcriptional regulator
MQRVTVTLDDELMAELESLMRARDYQNRSEALRDLARAGLQHALLDEEAAPECVATLVFVYDHEARELARRLTKTFHNHHDLLMSATQFPLDHHSGMTVAVLRGPTGDVRLLAESVLAERGVRHGRLVIVPARLDTDQHRHDGTHGHKHGHVRTR